MMKERKPLIYLRSTTPLEEQLSVRNAKNKSARMSLELERWYVSKKKQFLSFSQVKCVFASFERARIASNVISDISQLDGFEKLNPVDRNVIDEFIRAGNTGRKNPLPVSSQKNKSSQQNSSAGKTAFKQSTLPSIKVMFTNADQLTSSKN